MIGMGPIIITPPICTSSVFEVDCSTDPINIMIIPMNTAIIPAIISILVLMVSPEFLTLSLPFF